MSEKIWVDFNNLFSLSTDHQVVPIPSDEVRAEFCPGMRVTLEDREQLEVEANLEREIGTGRWYAKIDPSTWRDLPSPYDPGIMGKAVFSEDDSTLVYLLPHKDYFHPVSKTSEVQPHLLTLAYPRDELCAFLAKAGTPDLASKIAVAINSVLEGEEVEVTWDIDDFVHRCRFEAQLNEVVTKGWNNVGYWPARFRAEADAVELARRLNAILCYPPDDMQL